MMLALIPSELSIGGVYIAPSLAVGILGIVVTMVICRILNTTRLARCFWNPSVAFLALWVLTSAVIGLFVLAP